MAVNLLPDPHIFTQPQQLGFADMLAMLKMRNDMQGDANARSQTPAPDTDAGGGTGGGTFPRVSSGSSAGASPGGSSAGSAVNAVSPYDDKYAAADEKYKLPPGTMKGTGWIESRHNPKAWTKGSQYKGLMQIGSSEAKTHGVDVWDADSSIEGAAKIASANQFQFRQAMNRDPTAGELYLMHQQGPAGAMALLNNPDKAAWKAVRPFYGSDAMARKVISGNGGNPDAPASQFANHWISHFRSSTPEASVMPSVSRAAQDVKPWGSMTDQQKTERQRQASQAPITTSPGALSFSGPPSMDAGGVINEPAVVVSKATGQPIATVADNGPEQVGGINGLYNVDPKAGPKVWTQTADQQRPLIEVPYEDPGLFKAYRKDKPASFADRWNVPDAEQEDPGLFAAYRKPSKQAVGEGEKSAEISPSRAQKALDWIQKNPGHAALAASLVPVAPPLLGGALYYGARPLSYMVRHPGQTAGLAVAANEIAQLIGSGTGSATAKSVISTIEELMHAVGH